MSHLTSKQQGVPDGGGAQGHQLIGVGALNKPPSPDLDGLGVPLLESEACRSDRIGFMAHFVEVCLVGFAINDVYS